MTHGHKKLRLLEASVMFLISDTLLQTLMDPDRRATYDDIAGFSDVSTNPFLSSVQERDLVFVDEFTCIGLLVTLTDLSCLMLLGYICVLM